MKIETQRLILRDYRPEDLEIYYTLKAEPTVWEDLGGAAVHQKGEAAKLLAPWYNKKSFSLGYEGPHDALLWSHDLADQLLEGYEFLLPYYQYMMDVIADPDPREQ